MSWRIIVVNRRAKLDLQLGRMVIRSDETEKIVLSEISTVIVESVAVSITANLMSELLKRKIKIIFCDEKRNPAGELVGYYGSHDTSDKIRKQIAWGKSAKETIWTAIVTEKIRKQKEVLELFERRESSLLQNYLHEIQPNDATNREGFAAKVYFNALFGKTFSRRTDCVTNAALNYGYSIILSAFAREIVASGYLTQLGLFHDNMYNPFNFASDLMEPFRVLIDIEVIKRNFSDFTHDEKMKLVDILNHEIKICDKKQYVNNAIKIYWDSVFAALNNNDKDLIKFYEFAL